MFENYSVFIVFQVKPNMQSTLELPLRKRWNGKDFVVLQWGISVWEQRKGMTM